MLLGILGLSDQLSYLLGMPRIVKPLDLFIAKLFATLCACDRLRSLKVSHRSFRFRLSQKPYRRHEDLHFPFRQVKRDQAGLTQIHCGDEQIDTSETLA